MLVLSLAIREYRIDIIALVSLFLIKKQKKSLRISKKVQINIKKSINKANIS